VSKAPRTHVRSKGPGRYSRDAAKLPAVATASVVDSLSENRECPKGMFAVCLGRQFEAVYHKKSGLWWRGYLVDGSRETEPWPNDFPSVGKCMDRKKHLDPCIAIIVALRCLL